MADNSDAPGGSNAATDSVEAGPSGTQHTSTSSQESAPPQPATSAREPEEPPKCASCSKPETSPDPEENPVLKPCISCKSVYYCSRECKKNDTKKHKKLCPQLAGEWHKTHTVKLASAGGGGRKAPGEGHQRGLQKWQFDT